MSEHNLRTDVLIVGGGLGGVAAALAVLRRGLRAVLTEETDWIGGQLTTQGVPPDEHPWIEQFGATASYRRLRDGIRDYYRSHYPLTEKARGQRYLNPGEGRVSALCHEPRVAVAVLEAMIAPYRSSGRLVLLLEHTPVAVDTDGDRVHGATLRGADGDDVHVTADYVLDATELGDLLPMAGVEHVTGFESAAETGEPHAPEAAQPDNMQAISHCLAVEYRAGEDHVIDKPEQYGYWRSYHPPVWPAPLLSLTAPEPRTLETSTRLFQPDAPITDAPVTADQSKDPGDRELWAFRRIFSRRLYPAGFADSDISLINWPMIDYFDAPIIGPPAEQVEQHLEAARQLSLSMLYWLQTEAPRLDGGTGWPGLKPRGDVLGTADGMAKRPYVREARRIRAQYTIVEQDLSLAVRGDAGAVRYPDSVGIGMYRIDLHPSTGGDTYIDVGSSPFQIPLRALVPQRMTNLLPAGKNIGTTHITNGCYRLHPVEWNIGEAAGSLAAHCLAGRTTPHAVAADPRRVAALQAELAADGVELHWPEVRGF
ncbi:FAD-dependent oxidoreductase [Actinomadura physcomitrii]|uniref:FAD-dependent oxidoreductase n=1 Tax=Actinomadura physcomitrii TaxID=2650748 RepID=UPI00136E6EF3|nr:FAD-dependent oxidoreductase [Actinomadura physcomitrii]